MRVVWICLGAVAILSGCISCQPLLEVRACEDHECQAPSPDAVFIDWDDEHAQSWPQVQRLLDRTPLGDHEHQQWSREMEQAFWAYFDMEGEQPELFATYDETVYRIRVLSCE